MPNKAASQKDGRRVKLRVLAHWFSALDRDQWYVNCLRALYPAEGAWEVGRAPEVAWLRLAFHFLHQKSQNGLFWDRYSIWEVTILWPNNHKRDKCDTNSGLQSDSPRARRPNKPGFILDRNQRFACCSTAPRPADQTSFYLEVHVGGCFSTPGEKRVSCQADHSPPSISKFMNEWLYNFSLPIRLNEVLY